MNYLALKFHSVSKALAFSGACFLGLFSRTVSAQEQAGTQAVTLENPLIVNSIEELLLGILDIVIIIAIPIIIFFIIYAGFLYVTARGNSEKVSQASRALTYAVIGGVLVIGAIAITEIIRNLVLEFQNN